MENHQFLAALLFIGAFASLLYLLKDKGETLKAFIKSFRHPN
jgi:hypothetical protein